MKRAFVEEWLLRIEYDDQSISGFEGTSFIGPPASDRHIEAGKPH